MIPEIAAAEFFWPRMSLGGIIILDDYGWQGFDEQRLAFDKFAKEKNVPILSLPTGQALIIKE
jgi:CTP synthase (UTP-ammonia lyase)